ncbi:hypothetical protein DMH04_55105 [Kibdelosporangium aridum]|uniref:Uncharacterized protein n=1 Tax=Kibdelosporangium aridum TaxID=2030 RepID=A0A428XX46_KIBAR|nr:hypothetical protein [Kibdelosporangium aridum]RSM59936.1 hypothetical protein DMH04_55105 [Kibdelosporangium aridum]
MDRGLEDVTPSFVTPVSTIYDGYTRIMQTKRRGDTPLPEQLQAEFGIALWEWSRLKLVYEKALAGAPFAQRLIADIEADRITVSAAYGELKKREKIDAQASTQPSSVRLPVVYERVLRIHAFAQTTATALQHGVPVSTAGMSEQDITECIRLMRATSVSLKQAADTLSRSRLGGKARHGTTK